MSSTQIASLGLKLCGFLVILNYLPYVEMIFIDTPGGVRYTWSVVLVTVLVLALIAIFGSDALARLVVRNGEAEARFSASDLQAIALSVMGLYLVLLAIVQWGGLTMTWLQMQRAGAEGSAVYTATGVYLLIQSGVGVWLFFGGRRFANAVRRFQQLGIESHEASPGTRPNEFEVVAFSVVGLVFFVSGLDALLRVPQGYLADLYYLSQFPGVGPDEATPWGSIAWIAARILLGAAVFLGSRRLAAWWSSTTSPLPAA